MAGGTAFQEIRPGAGFKTGDFVKEELGGLPQNDSYLRKKNARLPYVARVHPALLIIVGTKAFFLSIIHQEVSFRAFFLQRIGDSRASAPSLFLGGLRLSMELLF